MKFAQLIRVKCLDNKNMINIGDYIELQAIINLYQEMGASKDIVYLDKDDVSRYTGEKLIWPINFAVGGYPFLGGNGNFDISEDITPVFLGTAFMPRYFNFSKYNVNFLKKYAPIGCRDYYSYQQMKKYDIPAYMAGCLTLTLPKRNSSDHQVKKTFLVDVPQEAKKYIPEHYWENSEVIHHIFALSEQERNDINSADKISKQLLKRYQEEAALIITSRLHCASPCMAMGIPTIMVKQYRGFTFDWIQNFAPLYTEDQYHNIQWNVSPLFLEEYKKLAKKVAIGRLQGTDVQNDIDQLNRFYMNGYGSIPPTEEMSIAHFVNIVKQRFGKDDTFNYAIWGVSTTAEQIYEYLSANYPKAKMVKVIETFSQKQFHGILSEKPDVLTRNDDFITIVATINCRDSGAAPLFAALGKDESQYIYAADSFIEK